VNSAPKEVDGNADVADPVAPGSAYVDLRTSLVGLPAAEPPLVASLGSSEIATIVSRPA
jgi:hypothetical protein